MKIRLIGLVILSGLLLFAGRGVEGRITTSAVEPTLKDWSCYADGGLDPCHNDLLAAASVDTNDGWAAGARGTILHWDGSTWTKMTSPTDQTLRGIAMAPDGKSGWMVGDEGTMLRFSGGSWSLVTPVTSRRLNAVSLGTDGGGQASAWAVGEAGTILHWDGAAWISWASPTVKEIYSVSNRAGPKYWMGGEDGVFLYDYVTKTWIETGMAELKAPARSVYANGNLGVWVAADSGANASALYYYEQNYSSPLGPIPVEAVTRFIQTPEGRGWGLLRDKPGGLILLTGTFEPWNPILTYLSAPGKMNLYGIGAGNGDAWLVGEGGVILRQNLETAQWDPSNPVLEGPADLAVVNSQNAWAVGKNGSIRHWDGSEWKAISSPTNADLRRVKMSGETKGWAIGAGGTILEFGIESGLPGWKTVSSGTTANLVDISLIGAERGYLVGDGNVLLELKNGQWSPVSSGFGPEMDAHFRAIDCVEGPACWISYTILEPPATGRVERTASWNPSSGWGLAANFGADSIAAVSGSEAWAANGRIYHTSGSSWEAAATDGAAVSTRVQKSGGQLWACNQGGTLYQYQGGAWRLLQTSTSADLLAVGMEESGGGWVLGEHGVLLRTYAKVFLPLARK